MKWILTFLLMMSMANAADFIRGEGKFVSQTGDGHEFVKSQLIYEGFADILSKEMKNLGLNKELFWQKYNEQLEKNYTVITNVLLGEMKIDADSSARDKKNYSEKLRRRKLDFKEKFGKLQSAISRFAIKKISRSSKYPNYRYIKLEGTVDSKMLTKIYYKFVAGNKRSEYGSLFLNVDYKLNGTTYSELGVENENDFADVISKKWIEWLEKNKPSNIANVVSMSDSHRTKLRDYQKLKSEEMLANTPELFVNSLILDIQINVIREKLDKRKNEYTFRYVGSGFLKDLQTNHIINTYEFDEQVKKYLVTPEVYLANVIVNHVYGMAIGSFPGIVSSIKGISNISSVNRVVIENYPNISTVLELAELMENRGVRYGLRAQVESISKSKADLIIHLDGKKSDIKSLLTSLKAAKKDLNYDLIEDEAVLGIKFNKLGAEKTI